MIKRWKDKLLVRLLWIQICILILGFLAVGLVITFTVTQDYVKSQSNYEYEKMRGDAEQLNEKLMNINAAITQLYQKDDNGDSIAMMLKESDSERKIKEFITKTIQSSPYISDIIVLNLVSDEVYAKSDLIYQCFLSTYNWKEDSFVKNILEKQQGVVFQEEHLMPGINKKRKVCTFGHKILDLTTGNPQEILGVILIEIPPEKLFEPMEHTEGTDAGNIFIMDKEHHILYENNAEVNSKEMQKIFLQYQQGDQSVLDRYLIRSKEMVSSSGLIYVTIMDKTSVIKKYFRHIFLQMSPILIVSLAICMLAIRFSVRLIGKRVNEIVRYTQIIQDGNLDEKIKIEKNDEFTAIETGLNVMTDQLSHYIEDKYVSDIALKKAQIKSLQLQMNPHFMFNTLESIRAAAILDGSERSAEMLTVLGDMYRWNLQKQDVVTLEDEMDYLDCYIELQSNRYGARLVYTQDVPWDSLECQIPKLTLQPIVENSLNHGFTPELERCEIGITGTEKDGTLYIEILDNGIGMTLKTMRDLNDILEKDKDSLSFYHIGMRNIHQRIQLLFGKEYGLFIQSERGKGTKVTIKIPVQKEKI